MNEINDWTNLPEKEERQDDVILAILRLSRALRRCAPERKAEPFPPAVGRLLSCIEKNSGVSSRELCELLDLRPSSLSELLSRGEADGLLTRTPDENDRRLQHVELSEKGQEIMNRYASARVVEYQKKTAYFTEAEASQFCELSRRLASHLESLATGPAFPDGRPPHGHPRFGGPGFPPPPGPHGFTPPDARGCPPPPGPHGFAPSDAPGCPPPFGKHGGPFPTKAPDRTEDSPSAPAPDDSEPSGPEAEPAESRNGRPVFPEGARFRC